MGGLAEPGREWEAVTVVVVGGGLAGITAALDLASAGAAVAMMEVRPRLGGAAYSFERDGLWLDNGQHVFLRCCTAYRALLERLGSSHHTILQDRLAIPVLAPGRKTMWLRRSGLPAPAHLAPALLRYGHLTARERLAAARAALALARVDFEDPRMDGISFGQWLEEHGQGPRAIEALWELISRPTLNLRVEDVSLSAAAFVFRTGLLEHSDAADIGYASSPLQRVHGDAALRALHDAGVDVRLGWRAERIEQRSDGALSVRGSAETIAAEAVVLAVPHERAAKLLPEGALRSSRPLAGLGTSPIVNLHLLYDRRVFDLEFAAAIESPVQYLFDRTESAGLEQGQCLAISLSAAEHEANASLDELRERFVAALVDLLPLARPANLVGFVVTREHAATFRAAPGTRALRPGPKTGIPGLALAGAWTDTGWPATMEGAVLSGHSAAKVALASVGRERWGVTVAA